MPCSQPEPFLVLHYTGLCNATCAHCVVESGPSRRDRIGAATAVAAIRGASQTSGMRMVVFSGGESFIYLDEVLGLCRQAGDLGLRTRIISNGYWARSPEVAARMLERLVDGGVDELVISFDEFHIPFIAPIRVRHIVAGTTCAARSPWVVYSAVALPDTDSSPTVEAPDGARWPSSVVDLLARYGLDLSRCIPLEDAQARLAELSGQAREAYQQVLKRERTIVSWQMLVVGGRATRELAGRVSARPIEEEPGSPCAVAGRQITIPTNGRAYPCCSLWTNFGKHHFGTVADEQEFVEVYRTIEADPLVRIIHDEGPGQLIRWMRGRGYAVRDTYTDICNMCEELLSRFSLDALRVEVDRYRQARLLDALIGYPDPIGPGQEQATEREAVNHGQAARTG